ncbi:helix-turn-helix domain-containing protein [Mesorhizobium sp.]|uniref:helix-turn-helix domain-containing protein n=1 Tax=Mesorhizobium sp. TaxID=1871066 RepID=UPI000FE93ACE|nr:helix-turn-helix domain-containing protein [Mesorhizobium sp.]RWO61334.1 MAG: hypothetical protein EOS14_08625 [Mesorhizobium sp.]
MSRLAKTDVLFAHMALALAPRISSAGKSVGSALIDHFNRVNGRCDPSIGRLATLLGIDQATVRRGTKELVTEGLFQKESHGGRFHTVSYRPQWEKFRAIVTDWNGRMKDGTPPDWPASKRARMRGLCAQGCAVDPRKDARQTGLRNRTKEPGVVDRPVQIGGNPDGLSLPNGRKGLRNERAKPQAPHYHVHPLQGGKRDNSPSAAAQAAADRKIAREIQSIADPKLRTAAWLRAMGETQ